MGFFLTPPHIQGSICRFEIVCSVLGLEMDGLGVGDSYPSGREALGSHIQVSLCCACRYDYLIPLDSV